MVSSGFPPTPLPHRRLAASLTRFAPAPTGWLHLGHVRNALHVWNTARATGAQVMLRIEDHDRERSRVAFEAGILDDLDWLGFAADVYPTAAFRQGRCEGRQSDRQLVYDAAVSQLRDEGLVYACECTRRELASLPAGADGEVRYPGTCRGKQLPLADGLGWRVRLEDRIEAFDDGLLGPQVQRPAAQGGDLLIRDRLRARRCRSSWTAWSVSIERRSSLRESWISTDSGSAARSSRCWASTWLAMVKR